MLADSRADALGTRFAAQWLRLQDVDKIRPDALLYPYWDVSLSDAFQRETELFFDSIVRDDRSVLDLLTADYSYINERIARHYGIPNVTGDQFRRVAMPENRRGILNHGSILQLTSVADRTSPVQRGKWIMQVIFGTPPPPPPPNVPLLEETKGAVGSRVLSVRERMEEHRANPACMSCHRMIDPLGLALENYDVTGKWRIKDNGVPVDAAGVMYDGTKIDGPAGLRRRRPETFGHVRPDVHRKPDDVRDRAAHRVLRHADRPRDRPRRRAERQPDVVVHPRRRQQSRLQNRKGGAHDHRGHAMNRKRMNLNRKGHKDHKEDQNITSILSALCALCSLWFMSFVPSDFVVLETAWF